MLFQSGRSRHLLTPGALFLLLLLLAGCATQTRSLLQHAPQAMPRQAELRTTPFFPQERYQCGPAALAMTLNAAGISITPEALVSQVYVPQREGSLQPEMLAAGRRSGALSMTIAPRMDALLTEIGAGNPVLVLQNLGLQWAPLWHYAVVIGYDLDREEVILRSGVTRREVMPLSTFEHTWARSNFWGMVALPAGRLPATADEASVAAALVALEKSSTPANAQQAYETALRRWPRNITLQLGYGNAEYAQGNRVAAAAAYRRATEEHPDSAPAFNNLATVLAELGQFDQARLAAERAVTLGGPWRNAAYATLQSIEAAQRSNQQK